MTSPITVTGASTGKRYACDVSAENNAGFSAPVAAPSLVVGTPARPGTVKALRLSKLSKLASGSVKVRFTAPANNGASLTLFAAKCVSVNGGISKTQMAAANAKGIRVSGLSRQEVSVHRHGEEQPWFRLAVVPVEHAEGLRHDSRRRHGVESVRPLGSTVLHGLWRSFVHALDSGVKRSGVRVSPARLGNVGRGLLRRHLSCCAAWRRG